MVRLAQLLIPCALLAAMQTTDPAKSASTATVHSTVAVHLARRDASGGSRRSGPGQPGPRWFRLTKDNFQVRDNGKEAGDREFHGAG